MPKNKYLMDYIPDKRIYKAVMFARKMTREGTRPQIAIARAAKFYDADPSDIASYMGQVGGRKRAKEATDATDK